MTSNRRLETKARKRTEQKGQETTEAERNIKLARRCEQFAFRLGLICEEKREQQKRITYYELNKHAGKGIAKHVGKHQWEQDLKEKMLNPGLIAGDSMIIPPMKRCTAKYHEEAVKQKAKAERAVRVANQKIYKAKADGQWAV